MKRFLFVLCSFFTISTIAQEVKTQKDILQIPNTDLVTDFNLKVKGDIKPIVVVKITYTDIGFSFVKTSFKYLESSFNVDSYIFKDGFLSKKKTDLYYSGSQKPNSFSFLYEYERGILKNEKSQSSREGKTINTTETSYVFDNKKNIKEKVRKSYGNIISTKYKTGNNKVLFSFSNVDKTLYLKNGLITKEETFNKGMNKTFIKDFIYNNNGVLQKEDRGDGKTIEYLFDDKNNVKKEINKDYDKNYKYIYDKYGNWIVAYALNTTDRDYNGNKTKVGLFGSKYNFYIRQIKYSNGEVTGSIDIKNSNTKSKIIELRKTLYATIVEGKKPVKNTKINTNSSKTSISVNKNSDAKASFKKLNNGANFNFLINGRRVGNSTKNSFMNNALLIYYPTNKQVYICEDFKNRADNIEYEAKKVNINATNGFWYKNKKGGVSVFNKDGVLIKKSIVYKYDTNKVDVIFRGQTEKNTVILENFKNVTPYILQSAKLHEDSFKTEELMNSLSMYTYKEEKDEKGRKVKGFFKNGTPDGPVIVYNNDGTTGFSNFSGSFTSTKSPIFSTPKKGVIQFVDNQNKVKVTHYEIEKKLVVEDLSGNIIKEETYEIPAGSKCLTSDCLKGFGVYKYSNGAIYAGKFHNNSRHGFGKLTFTSGQAYIGEFNLNDKSGIGSFTYNNGDYYMGEWKNDDLHGLGAYYFASSIVQGGIWDNGVYLKSLAKKNTNYIANNTKKNSNSSNSNNSNYNNSSSNKAKKVIRKTIEGLTVFPESGSLATLSAEAADMNATEYKLGNVGSYNGTPKGVAIISACDLDRKVVFIKSTKSESKTRGDYYFNWDHTEYYVSIINGRFQHEKVMFLGRDTHLTKRNKYNNKDTQTGYLATGITLNWSMDKDIFTIKSNRGKTYKVNMTKCLKL